MGFFTDMYAQVETDLEKLWQSQRDAVMGEGGGAEREAAADMSVQAARGGYQGTPLEKLLLTRNKALFAEKRNKGLSDLAASQAAQKVNLGIQKGQAILSEKQAQQQFITNLVGGAGSALGAALKIFGGPAGAAAGVGMDLLSQGYNKAYSSGGYDTYIK